MRKRFLLTLTVLLPFCQIQTTEVWQFELKTGERLSDFCKRQQLSMQCNDFDPSNYSELEYLETYAWKQAKGIEKLEGLLVPGTYKTDEQNLDSALRAMWPATANRIRQLEATVKTTVAGKAGLDPAGILKLASIVEKEAVTNHSYGKVARVFLNRIEKNDKLGSCPTVEYALGYHRPFLLFKDLELQSGYNVYKRRGLPPTAIAAFSDEALEATLNPAEGKWFFFVFDWTKGTLHFAEKYSQHQANAKVARANYIEKYGKENMYKALPGVFYDYSEGEKRPEGPFDNGAAETR